MAKRCHGLNPAKVKVDLVALEQNPPPQVFERSLRLRRRLTVALLNLLSAALLAVSFAPFDCWWAAYVALVPWTLALAGSEHRRWAILWSFLAGVFFWSFSLHWLMWITVAGYTALVVYLSLYWLGAALIVRAAMRRNWPMWVVLSVVWVALEYARAHVMSGFPWFLLAHSQYAQARLIQVSDLTGQYGVSFFVAMVNGAMVDLLSLPLFGLGRSGPRANRQIRLAAAGTFLAAAFLLGYGTWRLSQNTRKSGPVIGIVQQAFPIWLDEPPASSEEVFEAHYSSTRELVGAGCDLVIWPETMLPSGMNRQDVELVFAVLGSRSELRHDKELNRLIQQATELGNLSRTLGCPVLAGGVGIYRNPHAANSEDACLMRNSALWFDRDARSTQEYAKGHLVPFSEYVPFKRSWPWLHRLLRGFVPPVMAQLDPGGAYYRFESRKDQTPPGKIEQDGFELSRQGGREAPGGGDKWIMGTPICYEGTFPDVCRKMVVKDGKKVMHILANLSNDGWFVWPWGALRRSGSTEQAQHLTHYCFRAVENRVPVVRAVNTGISASIDSNGRIIAELRHHKDRTMVAGTLLLGGEGEREGGSGRKPAVLVDSRVSVYSIVGDVFAKVVGLSAFVLTAWMIWKSRGKTQQRKA